MMGKVFVFLADGFEEIEGLTVVDMPVSYTHLIIACPPAKIEGSV